MDEAAIVPDLLSWGFLAVMVAAFAAAQLFVVAAGVCVLGGGYLWFVSQPI